MELTTQWYTVVTVVLYIGNKSYLVLFFILQKLLMACTCFEIFFTAVSRYAKVPTRNTGLVLMNVGVNHTLNTQIKFAILKNETKHE